MTPQSYRSGARHGAVIALAVALAIALPGRVPAQDQWAQDTRIGTVTIAKPWARATPGDGGVGAAFMELRSAVGSADRLIGASTPLAATVELHDQVQPGGGAPRRRVRGLDIPPGNSIVLKPGSYHIKLVDLRRRLVEGTWLPLTLDFEKSGTVLVQVPIVGIGAMGPVEPKRLKSKSP